MGYIGAVLVVCGLLVSCHSFEAHENGSASRSDLDASVSPPDGGAGTSATQSDEPHEANAEPCDEFAVDRFCQERPERCTYSQRRKMECLDSASAEEINVAPNACGGMTISRFTGYTSSVLHYDGAGLLVGLELWSDDGSFCNNSHSTKQGRECSPVGTKVALCKMR
jgi:hypothetical protein